jgi:TerC family integral membrane protein
LILGAGSAGNEIPLPYWIGFGAIVAVMLFLDLAVFHRKAHQVKVREACVWTVVWVSLALAFNVWIYFHFGQERALNFLAGYLIEEALSVDNIFVFVVIFRYFSVRPEFQHRILFWGILGAVVMRLAFILVGTELIEHFEWTIYFLAIIVLYSAWKLLTQKEDAVDPGKNLALRAFKYFIPTVQEFEGVKFLVKRNGRLYATPLLLVLVVVEATDLAFAVDSVPAIIGITTDRFIVFTSNIFAILGLRSIYFVLAGMMDSFRFLKVGLSLILAFVGGKMLLSKQVDVPVSVALGVVAAILVTSVVASIFLPRHAPDVRSPEEGGKGAHGENEEA